MASSALLAACENSDQNILKNKTFDTPYGVVPFDQIKNSDYVPAFEAAIADVDKTIQLIAGNRNEPTFENTIIPFDRREEHLRVLTNLFFNLSETERCDTMVTLAETIMPMLNKASDDVYMNKELFERIKAVYDSRASLDSIQQRVTELYYNDFVRHGALLSEADQATLRDYNNQISLLSLKFGTNMLEETNQSYRLVIDTVADLAGLPENVITAAAERAEKEGLKGKWLFTLHNASLIPFLQYSDRRDLRKAMFDAYCTRANHDDERDNKQNVLQLASLRAKRAKLLGYANHAQYVIAENMAATPEAADSLLQMIWAPALKKAKAELKELKDFAWRYNYTTEIEASDWWYWTEKLRKFKFDLEEKEVSEYFVLENVQKGMFDVANKLYGITFKKVDDVPHYNADNVVYEVSEADGTYLGLIYFDWHPRSTKSGGAWCTYYQEPLDNFDGSRTPCIASIVCNFTTPTADTPALLSTDEVQTMFHEFGHSLQFLFTKGQYRRTAGVVPNDYVEMPSQIMEHWALEPEVLRSFAKHYKTGEVIPDKLIEKIERTRTFNQGFATTELTAAALLDLKWHTLSASDNVTDVNEFEAKAMNEIGLINEIRPRYRSTYFAHIFDGGYSADYYVYLWAELLDCDAYSAFKESGDIFNKDLADSFRKNCLSEVGNDTPTNQYLKFRGRKPIVDYLLKNRGLE